MQARTFGESGLVSIRVHGNGVLAAEDSFIDETGPITLHLSRLKVGRSSAIPPVRVPRSSSARQRVRFGRAPSHSASPASRQGQARRTDLRNKGIIIGAGGQLIMHGAVGVVPAGTKITDGKGTASWT